MLSIDSDEDYDINKQNNSASFPVYCDSSEDNLEAEASGKQNESVDKVSKGNATITTVTNRV